MCTRFLDMCLTRGTDAGTAEKYSNPWNTLSFLVIFLALV